MIRNLQQLSYGLALRSSMADLPDLVESMENMVKISAKSGFCLKHSVNRLGNLKGGTSRRAQFPYFSKSKNQLLFLVDSSDGRDQICFLPLLKWNPLSLCESVSWLNEKRAGRAQSNIFVAFIAKFGPVLPVQTHVKVVSTYWMSLLRNKDMQYSMWKLWIAYR